MVLRIECAGFISVIRLISRLSDHQSGSLSEENVGAVLLVSDVKRYS